MFRRQQTKLLVTCPSCGSHQEEPDGFISTICRACGLGFSQQESKQRPLRAKSSAAAVGQNVLVHCHQCGSEHSVPADSTSTQCPGCGAPISFEAVVITEATSRRVDTRGDLRVEKTGNLFCPLAICRNATVLGKISGSLVCEGRLTLLTRENLPVKIRAHEVVVPAGADAACPFPVEAGQVIVRGVLRANVLVNGTLHIPRKGVLVGAVCAKSIQVDQGGQLLGQMRISPKPWRAINANHRGAGKTELLIRRNPARVLPGSVY